jgi:two-component system chemotaxis sensor kinase CheA
LDRTIIEAIKDPLTHLVRNCCDHGIEDPATRARQGKPPQGRLLLRAYHEGGQVTIEVSDDGAGIDPEKVKSRAVDLKVITRDQADRMPDRDALHLVFRAGLSTAQKVSNVSGRGVGMDVVKTNVEKIGGIVDLVSTAGQGTTFKLKIPLTLAIIPGLIVTCGETRSAPRETGGPGGLRFVIPQVSLVELIRVEGDSSRRGIEKIQGRAVYRRRGALLPLVYLNEVLALGAEHERAVTNIVVLQAEDRQFGLVVDGIQDTQEIVVKPLGKHLKGLATYAGATILGDGKVALILDVMGIGQQSGVLARRVEEKKPAEEQLKSEETLKENFLLFRAGPFERLAVPLLRIARLEEFPRSKVEYADGRMVIQYRGEILGLVPLSGVLDPAASTSESGIDPLQVIVFNDGRRRIGLLVNEILDIVEANVLARQQSRRPGLLAAAVLDGKVTDFLDLEYILRQAFAEGPETATNSVSGLIAALEPAGEPVLEGSHEY